MTDSLVLRRTWARLVEARERVNEAMRLMDCGPAAPPCWCRDRVTDARDLLARDAWHVARGLEVQ